MRILTATLALLTLASPLAAQASNAPAVVDLSVVRQQLRSLIAAQESYFANNNRYSNEVGALSLTVADSITIRIVEFSPNAYSASGTLKGKTGVSCVVMIGNVKAIPKTEQGNAAKAEGGVLCDGDAGGASEIVAGG